MRSNIDTLKELGNEYFKDSFFNKPVKPVIRYGHNDLQIGKTFDGRVFTIDIREAMRILFMGLTGAGKTFLFRTIGDRLLKIDQTVAYLTDIKNEFYSSKFPVQGKFQHMLLPGEEPVGAKIVVLRPTFFQALSKTLPEHNVWYSVDMNELSRADFMTLLNSQDLQPNQRTTLELIYQGMKKKLEEEDAGELTYKDIVNIVDEMEEIDNRQRNTIKFKLKPLEFSHFFDSNHTKNVAAAMKNGYVPAVNFENFDSFGKGDLQYPEVTLNIVLREIIHARRAKKIKRCWIFIDEATRFVGNDKHNCFKESVLESIDVDRRFGVSYILAFQALNDVPDKVLSQSRYIFIPGASDTQLIAKALVNTGCARNVQISVNMAIRVKKRLAQQKYSWLVLDRKEARYDLILPLAPLSHHLEASR